MKVLSNQEAAAWCKSNDVPLSEDGLPERSDVDLEFKIPDDAGRRVYLANQGLAAFAEEPAYLVWFDDWAVWPSSQRMHVFDRFRLSYGEDRWLIDSPGHLFDQTETEDATSFVTIAILFAWDCYVVTPQRKKLFFVSHDQYGVTKGMNLSEVPWLETLPDPP